MAVYGPATGHYGRDAIRAAKKAAQTPSTPSTPSTPKATTTPTNTGGSNKSSGGGSKSNASPGAVQTTYTDPSGKSQTGYIINGQTYKDAGGSQRIDVGSIVNTAGGQYRLTDKGGVPYTAPQQGNVTQDNKAGQQGGGSNVGKTQVSYTDQYGKQQQGYIQADKTYTAEGKEVPVGSIVQAANGKAYMKMADGSGKDVTGYSTASLYGQDDSGGYIPLKLNLINYGGTTYDPESGSPVRLVAGPGQVVKARNGRYYDALTGRDVTTQVAGASAAPTAAPSLEDPAAGKQDMLDRIMQLWNQNIVADPTLTREQALALAIQQLNPQYKSALDTAMSQLDINAIRSGFYGQLPTEAIKAQTAGQLEGSKIQAINELASLLFGQSEEAAQNKLTAEQQAQQNKINTLLQLLGVYQNQMVYNDSRDDSSWQKAATEAGLTGYYNGQPTLDFLNYQRLLNQSRSGSGTSSGTGTEKKN